MAQNYHLILLEGFTSWSNMVEKLQSRRPPNSILQIRIFGTDNPNVMGRGGGGQGRHVPIALKSSPKSGQNMAKKVLK